MREFDKAEDLLSQVIAYSQTERTEYLKAAANMYLGAALAARGELAAGIGLVEGASQKFLAYHRHIFYILSETILGTIYLQILQGSGGRRPAFVCKNLGFLLKNGLFIKRKAEKHLTRAVHSCRQTGASGLLGQPCLQLGALYKLKGRREQAQEYLLEAVRVFQQCGFDLYLQRVQELLDSLA